MSGLPAVVADFADLPGTRRVLDALRPGAVRRVGGLWGSSTALLLAAVRRRAGLPILIVTADDGASADLVADLAAFGHPEGEVFPEQDHDAEGRPEPVTRGNRARILAGLGDDFLVAASIQALLQPVPAPADLDRGRQRWRAGTALDQEKVLADCRRAGLRLVPVVLAPGEVSRRGDVLDVFPLADARAYRLEFFDRELESIRTFDPDTQRSHEELTEVEVALGGGDDEQGEGAGSTWQYLPSSGWLVAHAEPLRMDERLQGLQAFDSGLRRRSQRLQDALRGAARLDLSALPGHDLDYKVLSAGSATGSGEADPVGRIRTVRGLRGRLHIACRTGEEQKRLHEIFAHKGVDPRRERITTGVGAVHTGFRIPELELTVLSNTEFAGVPARPRVVERPRIPSRAIASFFELGPGDLVVHAVHGIARFEGIELVERGEGAEDHLRLVFRNEVALLVPASKIQLVQKYIGAGTANPPLDKLGGRGFARRVEEVRQSLFDLAADLLEVQARREQVERPPYPPDPLEDDFLDAFPFEDTPDQRSAWREIRQDLEKPHPMDRLLCGDVGFGKTELALRTAFRVAVHGHQVAVLAPTTVLAEQHARTFARRFEPHGLRVEVLSRYRPAPERRVVLEDLAHGRVDVVVGTHKLLGKDVAFRELGLLVVDEEQRFGVRHKEHLKRLRLEVDVLTLTATPIPRTLHGSLLGIRNISTLGTPPPGRREIHTSVAISEPKLLQDALHRELSRGGQVFFLHNRVADLDALARTVEKLAPGAKVAVGHGQMRETQMERTVRRFIAGEFDVLVCTTIIENGLDLPRANTILIDRADQFGLAELHQLRGRVGRSDVQAFCYLLIDRLAPPGEDARKRLKALEELSHLGAGFAIAMKDLEIRGAGNLLGPQQSGHVAAVGYEMYCTLLRQAVENAAEGRPAPPPGVREVDVDLRVKAFLPESFLPDPKARLELLRQMDGAVDAASHAALERELGDRFGSLPRPVRNLLRIFRLEWALHREGVRAVQWVERDRLVAHHAPDRPLGGAWLEVFADVRPVEAGRTHLMLPTDRGRKSRSGERILDFLLAALSPDGDEPIVPACTREPPDRRGRRRSRS